MKIFVISHKPITVDLGAPFYPLYVGQAANTKPGLNDQTGDSISNKNSYYSELTAQYWVWKNLLTSIEVDEIVGFCHYRRFFSYGLSVNNLLDIRKINHTQKISDLLQKECDVLLAKQSTFPLKQHWFSRSIALKKVKFPWESLSLFEQFELEHDVEDLISAAHLLPKEHKEDFISYLNGYSMSAYNMYAAKPAVLENYFATLFPWLFEVEKQLDLKNKDSYQARLPGFISERFASYYFNKLHQPAFVDVSFLR
jgi:hypothetical protein